MNYLSRVDKIIWLDSKFSSESQKIVQQSAKSVASAIYDVLKVLKE